MGNGFIYLNPDDFKKWMNTQTDFESNLSEKTLVGMNVETKFGDKRIAKHMIIENGKPSRVRAEFIEDGGTIMEVNGDDYLIEVPSGTFQINKRYVIV